MKLTLNLILIQTTSGILTLTPKLTITQSNTNSVYKLNPNANLTHTGPAPQGNPNPKLNLHPSPMPCRAEEESTPGLESSASRAGSGTRSLSADGSPAPGPPSAAQVFVRSPGDRQAQTSWRVGVHPCSAALPQGGLVLSRANLILPICWMKRPRVCGDDAAAPQLGCARREGLLRAARGQVPWGLQAQTVEVCDRPVDGACLTVADQPVRLQVWGAQRLTRAQSTDLVSPRLPRPSSTSRSFNDRNVFSPSSGILTLKVWAGPPPLAGPRGRRFPRLPDPGAPRAPGLVAELLCLCPSHVSLSVHLFV